MLECIFGCGKRHGTVRKTKLRTVAHVVDFLRNLIRLKSKSHHKNCRSVPNSELQKRRKSAALTQPTANSQSTIGKLQVLNRL